MGLRNEGESWALDLLLRGAAPPTNFYVGLYTNATEPVEGATLASGVTEVTGGSYARVLCERSNIGWPTLELSGDDWRASTKSLSYPVPTASWGTVRGLFLTTVSTGTAGVLIATYHLLAGLVVNNADPAPVFVINQKAA